MKILIYGINYSPELTGIGKYTGEMATWFAQAGQDIRVITAPPYYPEWKVGSGFSALRYKTSVEKGVRVTRCPLYVPKRLSVFKRLIHLCSFSLSSLFPVLAQAKWKPELIMLVAPTLFCSLQALLLAKLTGAQVVLHIQDYEVDAMFGLLTGPSKLAGVVRKVERWLLNRFDWISTISPGMIRRARTKGVDATKLMMLPNWSELERFENIPVDIAYRATLGLNPAKRSVLYSGNLGEKQGLEDVLEAAQRLSDRDDIEFLIVGDGAAKERLMAQAKQMQLTNLTFAPLQSYDNLPKLLASVDCHLVVQRRGAADAVMPSKLTNILAVGGNSVITADPDTSLGVLCEEYPGIALLVEPESVDALIAGIERCLELTHPNPIASEYARTYLDKDTILCRFLAAFDPTFATRRKGALRPSSDEGYAQDSGVRT